MADLASGGKRMEEKRGVTWNSAIKLILFAVALVTSTLSISLAFGIGRTQEDIKQLRTDFKVMDRRVSEIEVNYAVLSAVTNSKLDTLIETVKEHIK
jgi:hypothetical protein